MKDEDANSSSLGQDSLSFSSSSEDSSLPGLSPCDEDEIKQQEVTSCPSPFTWLMKQRPAAFEVVDSLEETGVSSRLNCFATLSGKTSSRRQTREEVQCSALPRLITTRNSSNTILSSNDTSKLELGLTSDHFKMGKLSSWFASSKWPRVSATDDFTGEELSLSEDIPTVESDLKDPSRPVWVVTTAAIPWFTGTAVNPLLRAAHLLKYRQEQHRQEQHRQEQHRQEQHRQEHGTLRDGVVCELFGAIHLVIPWLESEDDRIELYGTEWKDATQTMQTEFICQWLSESANMPLSVVNDLKIHYYPARYHPHLSSIFAMGDIFEIMHQTNKKDEVEHTHKKKAVCILEEPEHLNVYRAPSSPSCQDAFYTVGIIHTNYKYYVEQHVSGVVTAPIVESIFAGLVRAYCDQVIKLSDVLQDFAKHKEVVCNVHGIRDEFLHQLPPDGDGIYFLGKLMWAKGFYELMYLQDCYKKEIGSYFVMDIYGNGPEKEEIQSAYAGRRSLYRGSKSWTSGSSSDSISSLSESSVEEHVEEENALEPKSAKAKSFSWSSKQRRRLFRSALPVEFRGRFDHAKIGSHYKVFVNPSVSEVLCTTTAEALAMGKFVVLPVHPSNNFFHSFPNALFYRNEVEFVEKMCHAQRANPEPVSDELRHLLTWEAATERLFASAEISEREARRRERLYGKEDRKVAMIHYELFKGRKGDVMRKVIGGGPVANQVQYRLQRQQCDVEHR